MAQSTMEREELLTPSEVAEMFRVDPKTVTRWAQAGKLHAIRTLGGHRRYRRQQIQDLLDFSDPLTIKQVAEQLGQTDATIKSWAKEGRLKARKVSGRWQISSRSVGEERVKLGRQ